MARTLAAVVVLALLAGSLCAFDDTSTAGTDEITRLIEQLGDADYDTRNAAEKRLDAIGETALPALQEARTSNNLEASRRAEKLIARIGYRAENRKNLAPTLVSFDLELASVRDVLAELSKQAKYPVSLDLNQAGDRANKKITIKLNQVPFWEAVLALCDAADLRIHSVAGFVAPDSRDPQATAPIETPQPQPPGFRGRPSFGSGAAPAPQPTSNAIVLTPRNGAVRRPAAVYGAVCVEAIQMPAAAGVPEAAAVLLNVWPEPRLNWQENATVRVDRAEDEIGQVLSTIPGGPPAVAPQILQQGNGVVMVKQVNGGVVIVNGNANVPLPVASAESFVPSIRQSVVKLKPGSRASSTLTEFQGSIFGSMRVAPQPIITLRNVKPGASVVGSNPAGAQMSALLSKDVSGKWRATIELSYDGTKVQPGNTIHGLHGLKVMDAEGKAFTLSASSIQHTFRNGVTWTTLRLTCTLSPTNNTSGDPAIVTFTASYPKPVEVPFRLNGVPVTGGR